jgi:hypothetical protein
MKPGKVETLDIALMMLAVCNNGKVDLRWKSQPLSSTFI